GSAMRVNRLLSKNFWSRKIMNLAGAGLTEIEPAMDFSFLRQWFRSRALLHAHCSPERRDGIPRESILTRFAFFSCNAAAGKHFGSSLAGSANLEAFSGTSHLQGTASGF